MTLIIPISLSMTNDGTNLLKVLKCVLWFM